MFYFTEITSTSLLRAKKYYALVLLLLSQSRVDVIDYSNTIFASCFVSVSGLHVHSSNGDKANKLTLKIMC
jgi:hypothetical protein